MRRHDAHSPHGSPFNDGSSRRSQFSAIASTRPSVVFPTPRGPQSKYPFATRPCWIAPLSVVDTCDCTATSANRFGRYLRARARDIRCVRKEPKCTRWWRGAQKKRGGLNERGPPRSAPGLTKRHQTPRTAATFGVLTELEG